LVTTLDLYDLLLHGDNRQGQSAAARRRHIHPAIGNTLSVDGAVRRPAIYELKGEKTVAQAIEIAGGLLPDADQKLGQTRANSAVELARNAQCRFDQSNRPCD